MDNIYLVAKHVAQCEYMEPQKAIEELTKLMGTANCKDALRAGIEALKKQIPKVNAPYAGQEYDENHPVIHDIWCAECNSLIEDATWIYCPYCGQKIDWTKDKLAEE